jgi:hypothetical protein
MSPWVTQLELHWNLEGYIKPSSIVQYLSNSLHSSHQIYFIIGDSGHFRKMTAHTPALKPLLQFVEQIDK